MKRQHVFTYLPLLFIILVLAACGTAPPAVPTPTPVQEINGPDGDQPLEPLPTTPLVPSIEPLPETYPPPEIVAPNRSTLEPGYPPPATFPPTVDPYPGGFVWIIRPVGVQCEDGTAPGYADLHESVATLTAAGMQVEESEMIELMVTAVCGSPTSAHYRIKIHVDDLDTAQAMGWRRE